SRRGRQIPHVIGIERAAQHMSATRRRTPISPRRVSSESNSSPRVTEVHRLCNARRLRWPRSTRKRTIALPSSQQAVTMWGHRSSGTHENRNLEGAGVEVTGVWTAGVIVAIGGDATIGGLAIGPVVDSLLVAVSGIFSGSMNCCVGGKVG